MSITGKISTTVTSNGASPVAGSQSETGNVETRIDENYPASTVRSLLAISFTRASLQLLELVADQNLTVEVNGTDEVQTLTITGTPAGGSFTLTYSGQTTAAIPFNASNSAVQTALENLSNIAVGDVVCAGGPLPGTPVTITFKANLGLQNVAAITTTDSLTGGSSPASAISTTTAGVAADTTLALKAGMPLVWGVSAGYFAMPFAADITKFSITCTTASRLQGKVLTS